MGGLLRRSIASELTAVKTTMTARMGMRKKVPDILVPATASRYLFMLPLCFEMTGEN